MMLIHKNVIIADKVKFCDNIFLRSKGLRFAKRLKTGQALVMASAKEDKLESIVDTFFVFSFIDVVWLNAEKEVVDVKHNVRPFTAFVVPEKPAKYIVELARDAAKNIRLGDKIEFGP